MYKALAALAAVLCLLTGDEAVAQETAQSDADLTRPILFSVRPEYFQIPDGVWRAQVIARYDHVVVRRRRWFSGHRGMLLRFEVPTAFGGAPSVDSKGGLGDAYAQLLVVPRLSGRFALVAGSGLSIPTATSLPLGTGKWTLAPAVAPVWFLRGRGMAHVKFQDFFSIAGDSERLDHHFLLITPTIIHSLPSRSWILVDTEAKVDWRNDRKVGVKSGVQFGKILPIGIGLWVKPEIWYGPNRGGEWNLKTGLVWYR